MQQNGVKENEEKPFYTAPTRTANQQRDKIATVFCEGVDSHPTHPNPSTGPGNSAAPLTEKGKRRMNKL